MNRIFACAAFLSMLLPQCAAAQTRYTPAADISVMGGQYFFNSAPASLRMKADAFFSPALQFGDDSQLVPILPAITAACRMSGK